MKLSYAKCPVSDASKPSQRRAARKKSQEMNLRYVLSLLCTVLVMQAAEQPPNRQGDPRQPQQDSKCNEVPLHPFDIILGRPTTNSITASVLCYEDTEGFIAYGTHTNNLDRESPRRLFKQGEPVELALSDLRPDTKYFYQFRSQKTNSAHFAFHTARPPGSTFTFTVTADSHLDEQTDPVLFQRTLANALADQPDFHIDLGDTFMTEKHASREQAARQYLAQRYYLGQLCNAPPLFLVLGNHDGESPIGRADALDSLAVWANTLRKRYFPNPVPEAFYSGNATPHVQAGLLQDYYAWEWGDALFIVLDPYWFTKSSRGRRDNWSATLGTAQYKWLQHTLENSQSAYKFVFIHNLVGGVDNQSRGGVEVALFYEWGGKNSDGTDGFKQNRPTWASPVHQLLVKNRVNIVFHGHDHFYARQELDGIVYQEVPQPGHPGGDRPPRSAEEYGYRSGTILGGSGHLCVIVAPDRVNVCFLRVADEVTPKAAHSYFVFP
jgi:hypothetical protein